MTARRALLDVFTVDTLVSHALYPELGTGSVTWVTPLSAVSNSSPIGRVAWPTGQVSTHSLLVLRVATNG